MYFEHSTAIRQDFPGLVPVALTVRGVTADADVAGHVADLSARAKERLAGAAESELPEIQAWRRTFTALGLKPTQYRCAAESLLRRFRKEGSLPRLHPLVDLCNATSMAYAVPIAVFDTDAVTDHLEVRYATGDESYLTFGGDVEHPPPRRGDLRRRRPPRARPPVDQPAEWRVRRTARDEQCARRRRGAARHRRHRHAAPARHPDRRDRTGLGQLTARRAPHRLLAADDVLTAGIQQTGRTQPLQRSTTAAPPVPSHSSR